MEKKQLNGSNYLNRKQFIGLTTKTLAASALTPIAKLTGKRPLIKAIAFDAYTLFDTNSLLQSVEELFPGKSKELMNIWRNRQFEYTWLRTLTGHYKNFWEVTEDALVYTAAFLKLNLNGENKNKLMQAFLDMRFVKDAGPSLRELKRMSIKLAILSNATPEMLYAGINNSELQNIFDFVISTDNIKSYKPIPAAYQLGVDAFQLKKEEILFAAFGGWDEAGAKSFGYPTAWINPLGLPVEQLDVQPDFICKNLTELAMYVQKINQ